LPLGLRGGDLIVCDNGYAGKDFETTVTERFGALILRPARKTESNTGPHLAPIRQCIESIFWTLKDRLGLERHNARTLHGLRARITSKLLALAAGVWLNHSLHQPAPRTPEPPIRRPRPLTQRGINHLGRSPSLKRRPAGLRECVHLQPEYALSLRELAQVLRGVVYSCAP
jgi:hypothetical protein